MARLGGHQQFIARGCNGDHQDPLLVPAGTYVMETKPRTEQTLCTLTAGHQRNAVMWVLVTHPAVSTIFPGKVLSVHLPGSCF